MPTSVTVNDLKINELTEAQYDAAVQGGVIGENELSVITDMESLPDQTGNAGKFLTTDGTDASWSDKPLVNTATGANSITILGTPTTNQDSVNIGIGSVVQREGVSIGKNAYAPRSSVIIGEYPNGSIMAGSYGVAIGACSKINTTIGYEVAIGYNACTSAKQAIQIGNINGNTTTNSDANTFKVANANGNFEMMNANGNLPADRLASTTGLADGNYRLRLVMASGVPTLEWVAE